MKTKLNLAACIIVPSLCVGFYVVVLRAVTPKDSTVTAAAASPTPARLGSTAEASAAVKMHIKREALTPSTIKWSSVWDEATSSNEVEPGVYLVTGWFDAQNGFGAMVRTHYSALAKVDGNSKWTILLDTK